VIGYRGLVIAPHPHSPIPNPQSPIPNPQYFNILDLFNNYKILIIINLIKNNNFKNYG